MVDPQVGLCDPNGSLAAAYGASELEPIDRVMAKIAGIADREDRAFDLIAVISEYAIGQHTKGDTGHPLAGLCVPVLNQDCQLCQRMAQATFDAVFIKSEKSALSSGGFRDWLDLSLRSGVNRFIICGVLLEHCVQETALDLMKRVASLNGEVTVCRDLVASRKVKYKDGDLSIVEESVRPLLKHGVRVQSWNEVKVERAPERDRGPTAREGWRTG